MLEKKPFVKYDDEQKNSKGLVIPLRLNEDQINMLNEVRPILEQTKDSTLIKQLMLIGYYNVIHDKKLNAILGLLFKNKRNNERQGIADFD